jgi:hypothetical protein
MIKQAINSKIDEIAQLRFHPLPVRPIAVERAVRSGETYVVIGKDGKIYTSEVARHVYWTTVDRKAETIACLIKLNMLSPRALAQHRAADQVEAKARAKKYAASVILDNADGAGIKLTATQIRKLETVALVKVER